MKKRILFLLLPAAFFHIVQAQESALNNVLEYCPAPGQFVHELPLYEKGDDAEKMAMKCLESLQKNKPVSLGGFGGYITVGFDHPILNLPGQKDFQIMGNAFEGSAEPGIVMVSADTNGDGKPNDQWYELAGSEYTNPVTIHEYEITYTRPSGSEQSVPWKDNQGRNGTIEYMGGVVDFHKHPHFPEWITENTLTFTGTCLPDNGSWDKEKKMWVMKAYAYGYADNYPNVNTEGCSFDIGWATNADGEQVNLESIDFVRIYTGVNQQIPSEGVGELSTEVAGVHDLHPSAAKIYSPLSGKKQIAYYENGRIFIKDNEIKSFDIYDVKGHLIHQTHHFSDDFMLYLPKGIYILRSNKGIFKLCI